MGKKNKGKSFYAVAIGQKVGIFNSWDECEDQVKGYPGARYKSFHTRQETQEFIKQHSLLPGTAAREAPINANSTNTNSSSGSDIFGGICGGFK